MNTANVRPHSRETNKIINSVVGRTGFCSSLWMLPCDSEGYIVESRLQWQLQKPGQLRPDAHQRVLDLVQEQRRQQKQQRRQARRKGTPGTVIVRTQEALGDFYHQAAAFIETRLFTRATFRFLSKYFLYPFLSGAFSATLSLYRTVRRG